MLRLSKIAIVALLAGSLQEDRNVPPAYGCMHIYTLGTGPTVSVGATDHFYQIASGVSGGLTREFTFQNARELKVNMPGTYQITWALAVGSTTGNQQIEGTIMIDGTANTSFASHTEVINVSSSFAMSGSGVLALVPGNLISLAVLNHTAIHDITVDHLTLTVSRLGN